MTHEYMHMMEEVLENVVSASSVSTIVAVAAYVFSALGLYTIARRREIGKAWMAWVPVLNMWILGSISDQYRYVARGEVKNKRKVLLVVGILQFAAGIAAAVKLIVTVVLAFSGVAQGMDGMELLRLVLSGMVFYIPVLILGIVALVFRILALYDLFTSCDPANNVLYLILCLIPGINRITQPLFLFLCRNLDGGMPPRRTSENSCEF